MTRRLVLSFLGLTLGILLALEIPLAINYGDRLRNDLSANLVRDAYTIAGYSEETVEGTAKADLGQMVGGYEQRTGGRTVIVDGKGRVLADSRSGSDSDFSSRPEIEAALRGEVSTGTRHSDTLDTELLYAAVPIASGGQVHGAVRITYSTEQINERWWRYLLALAGIATVSLATAAILGVLFARWVARPLRTLETTATALGAGDLQARADPTDGPLEVRQLATTFNSMARQVEDLLHAQEAFVADASHQLRTPLAALQLQIENLQSDLEAADDFDHRDREDRRTARADAARDLEACLGEASRLSRIVDGLLALARADRASAVEPRALDAVEVLEDRQSAWEAFATERSTSLTTEPGAGRVLASEDHLTQALDNLIANAIDATPADGHIVLRAEPASAPESGAGSNGYVELHVSDDGPGLTEEARRRAFDRFWSGRTDDGKLGGSGLGLAIARKLVRANGGDIELRASESGGVDAVIRLPSP